MSLFFDEEEMVQELRNRGYRVVKVDFPEGKKVSTVKDLVDFFYAKRRFYNPDRTYPYSIDYSADSKYVSSFVQSRQKLGLGRKQAIEEAAVLIDALFKFEEHLNLKEPVIHANILAVRPIMDRICAFANGEVAEAGETDTLLQVNQWNEYYNKHFAEQDFEKAAKERNKILELLNDGKNRK